MTTPVTTPAPADIETEKRRRGIILLLVLAPVLLVLGAIIAGLDELGASLHSPLPGWLIALLAVVSIVLSLLPSVQLLIAGVIQVRRGIRTGLSWAAVWVGAALLLLGLLSVLGLALVLFSR